jgi:hypothetical protein
MKSKPSPMIDAFLHPMKMETGENGPMTEKQSKREFPKGFKNLKVISMGKSENKNQHCMSSKY